MLHKIKAFASTREQDQSFEARTRSNQKTRGGEEEERERGKGNLWFAYSTLSEEETKRNRSTGREKRRRGTNL